VKFVLLLVPVLSTRLKVVKTNFDKKKQKNSKREPFRLHLVHQTYLDVQELKEICRIALHPQKSNFLQVGGLWQPPKCPFVLLALEMWKVKRREWKESAENDESERK
jgi:hypothetical protein